MKVYTPPPPPHPPSLFAIHHLGLLNLQAILIRQFCNILGFTMAAVLHTLLLLQHLGLSRLAAHWGSLSPCLQHTVIQSVHNTLGVLFTSNTPWFSYITTPWFIQTCSTLGFLLVCNTLWFNRFTIHRFIRNTSWFFHPTTDHGSLLCSYSAVHSFCNILWFTQFTLLVHPICKTQRFTMHLSAFRFARHSGSLQWNTLSPTLKYNWLGCLTAQWTTGWVVSQHSGQLVGLSHSTVDWLGSYSTVDNWLGCLTAQWTLLDAWWHSEYSASHSMQWLLAYWPFTPAEAG